MSDSLSLVVVAVVAICAFILGQVRQTIVSLQAQVVLERARADEAKQQLIDVLAIPLPKGYGAALGATPPIVSDYEKEQARLLRANFDSD